MASRPQILCISLSPITRDARVLRQISVLAEFGDVTTVGYGPAPSDSAQHLEIPGSLSSLPQTPRGVFTLALHQFDKAEGMAPALLLAKRALEHRRFDLVVANDARVLAFAESVRHGAPLWADMHEWAPEERTHVLAWRVLIAPLMTHMCATYLPRASVVTTVCESIADLYRDQFDVSPSVLRNSALWQDLVPSSTVADRIRLVHSGAAIHGRSLETMIDTVKELGDRFTLDLYLVPGGDGGRYLSQLKTRAGGAPNIRFRDPVAPRDLPRTLNAYDVGVFWIPPTHTNARLTLPNKFFDFVQARLMVAVGPSVEMQRIVEQHGLGVIAGGFTTRDCVASLRNLDVAAVERFKRASHQAARDLSFEVDAERMRALIAQLL